MKPTSPRTRSPRPVRRTPFPLTQNLLAPLRRGEHEVIERIQEVTFLLAGQLREVDEQLPHFGGFRIDHELSILTRLRWFPSRGQGEITGEVTLHQQLVTGPQTLRVVPGAVHQTRMEMRLHLGRGAVPLQTKGKCMRAARMRCVCGPPSAAGRRGDGMRN